jgi:hypothetical protein
MASSEGCALYKRTRDVHEFEHEREITPEAPRDARDAARAKRLRAHAASRAEPALENGASAGGCGDASAALDYDALLLLLGVVEAARDGSSSSPQLATTPIMLACDDGSEAAGDIVCACGHVHWDIQDDGDDDNVDGDGENDESDESDEESEDSDDSNSDGHESEGRGGGGVASTRCNGADDDTPCLEHGVA